MSGFVFCPGLTARARVCRMGAETETDGQGDAMKRKRYKLYDNYTTYYILVGIALMYALLAALNIWIYKKCDAVSEKIALMLVLDIPGCIFLVLAYKPQVLSRFLTRCSFDAEGIHCRSPRWGHFTLRWDEIRTYGFGVNSFSYMSASFLYFSRNEVEYVPKNGMELLRIGRDRIIFQYRPSIWAALTEYMPKDMVKRLDDVIRNERGGHFRRRPGA